MVAETSSEIFESPLGLASAVFLDRDGVINHAVVRGGKPRSPATLADLKILPGVSQAVRLLKKSGFMVIVVTNQPNVGAGTQRREVVEAMHVTLRQELAIDDIKVCFHTDSDRCPCRKPAPGMLVTAATQHGIDLCSSFMIGDRWRDVDAGKAAGCKTCLIDRQYPEDLRERPDYIFASLLEAARSIVMMTAEDRVDNAIS